MEGTTFNTMLKFEIIKTLSDERKSIHFVNDEASKERWSAHGFQYFTVNEEKLEELVWEKSAFRSMTATYFKLQHNTHTFFEILLLCSMF